MTVDISFSVWLIQATLTRLHWVVVIYGRILIQNSYFPIKKPAILALSNRMHRWRHLPLTADSTSMMLFSDNRISDEFKRSGIAVTALATVLPLPVKSSNDRTRPTAAAFTRKIHVSLTLASP